MKRVHCIKCINFLQNTYLCYYVYNIIKRKYIIKYKLLLLTFFLEILLLFVIIKFCFVSANLFLTLESIQNCIWIRRIKN